MTAAPRLLRRPPANRTSRLKPRIRKSRRFFPGAQNRRATPASHGKASTAAALRSGGASPSSQSATPSSGAGSGVAHPPFSAGNNSSRGASFRAGERQQQAPGAAKAAATPPRVAAVRPLDGSVSADGRDASRSSADSSANAAATPREAGGAGAAPSPSSSPGAAQAQQQQQNKQQQQHQQQKPPEVSPPLGLQGPGAPGPPAAALHASKSAGAALGGGGSERARRAPSLLHIDLSPAGGSRGGPQPVDAGGSSRSTAAALDTARSTTAGGLSSLGTAEDSSRGWEAASGATPRRTPSNVSATSRRTTAGGGFGGGRTPRTPGRRPSTATVRKRPADAPLAAAAAAADDADDDGTGRTEAERAVIGSEGYGRQRRVRVCVALGSMYGAWVVLAWFTFAYGRLVHDLLGSNVEAIFTRNWIIGAVIENALQWRAVCFHFLESKVVLFLLETCGLLPLSHWLERHLDFASVQVRSRCPLWRGGGGSCTTAPLQLSCRSPRCQTNLLVRVVSPMVELIASSSPLRLPFRRFLRHVSCAVHAVPRAAHHVVAESHEAHPFSPKSRHLVSRLQAASVPSSWMMAHTGEEDEGRRRKIHAPPPPAGGGARASLLQQ